MKLYVKQKFLSLIDRFTIIDENYDDAFVVEGEWFTLSKKLTIYNTYLEPVAYLKQQLFRMMAHVDVSLVNQQNFTLIKRFTILNQRYVIEGDSWHVEGDFFAHDYKVFDGDELVATISKAWLRLSDYYEVNVIDSKNGLKVLTVVLAIDIAMSSQNNM